MRTLFRCASFLLLTSPLVAQTAQDAAVPAPGAPAPPGVTLHASARLVVVDVSVTDAHGKPVRGLPRDSFHLNESGHAQTLADFEEHSSAAQANVPALPPLQPGVFTNAITVAPDQPVTVLLLDALNTAPGDQHWVRQKLVDYLHTSPAGRRMAICVLTDHLVMLQNLTADPELLRAALDRAKPKNASTGNSDLVRAFDLSQIPEEARDAFRPLSPEWINLNEDQRAQMSLRAFHELALYLAGLPGRKNLIWFSSAFPLNLLPKGRAQRFAGDPRWGAEYRATVDLLTRNRVAIYTVDARGLLIPSVTTAPNRRNFIEGGSVTFETQQALTEVADDTGGKAFLNTNGLGQAVAEVIATSGDYYTLAYRPTGSEGYGEFRPISIRIDGASGDTLAYRRGYIANPSEAANETGSSSGSGSAMQSATALLAPPSTQITFFARVLPMPTNAPDVDAPGEKLRPVSIETGPPADSGKEATSNRKQLDPSRNGRVSIEYSTDIRNIATTATPDGGHRAHVEFVALVYDAEGRVVRSDVKPVRIVWDAAQFAYVQQHGLRYLQQVSEPAGGATTLRLLIHDLTNDHVGSLDVTAGVLQK